MRWLSLSMMLIADEHDRATAGSGDFEDGQWPPSSDGPIDGSTARHDVKRHSCRDTSRLSELIWWSFRAISFWLCKTSSAGPI